MPKPILIVDDNPDEIEILVLFLRGKGISNPIHIVQDGLAAIDYLYGLPPYANRQTHPFPALVFLDIHLPGASGYEVLQWLRAHPEIPAPRLIGWTNAVNVADLLKGEALGISSFLFKLTMEEQFRDLLIRYPDLWTFADPQKSSPPSSTTPPPGS